MRDAKWENLTTAYGLDACDNARRWAGWNAPSSRTTHTEKVSVNDNVMFAG
jgi:hypothetical protein